MIISRTPLRISLFGGGSDFPEYFRKYGGAVIGTAIDKYVYHSIMRFPSKLFDYKVRLAYSKVECVKNLQEITHAPFRESLKYMGVKQDVEISISSDLPSFTGLGSSSSFTVGLLNALAAFQHKHRTRKQLASEAINLERNILREAVGCQDQVFAAFGGICRIDFHSDREFDVEKIVLSPKRLSELKKSLMLVYTGIKRRAYEIERRKIKNVELISDFLKAIHNQVDVAHKIIVRNGNLSDLGELLHHSWCKKRNLDEGVSNPFIDELYDSARKAGALGGKLLGAGGGGFMLLFVPPKLKTSIKLALSKFPEVTFCINAPGSMIIHS